MLEVIDGLKENNEILINKRLPEKYRLGYMRGLADGYSDLSARINKMEGMDL